MPTKSTLANRLSLRTLNALRNGTKAYRLSLGELPKPLCKVTRYCRQYRTALEEAVEEASGGITISQAHAIDAAAGHEQHLQIMRWLLREKLNKMTIADIIKCSSAMAQARDNRNKAVLSLNLDRDVVQDAIEALYSPVIEPEGENKP